MNGSCETEQPQQTPPTLADPAEPSGQQAKGKPGRWRGQAAISYPGHASKAGWISGLASPPLPSQLCSTRWGLHSAADPGRIVPSAAGTNACSLPAPLWWPHKRDLVRSVPAPTSHHGQTPPSRSGSGKRFLGAPLPKSRGSIPSLATRGEPDRPPAPPLHGAERRQTPPGQAGQQ